MPQVEVRLSNASGQSAPAVLPYEVEEPAGLALGHYDYLLDGWNDLDANNSGDQRLAAALGEARPVVQMIRGYSGNSYPTSLSGSMAHYASYGGRVFLNAKIGGQYDLALAGGFDDQWRALFQNWPVGVPGWVTLQHEPENDAGIVPDKWCRTVGRWIDIVAPVIRSRSLPCGVGGMLMGSFTLPTNSHANWSTWNWWQHVLPENLDQTVWMVDEYAQHTIGPPIRGNSMHAQLVRMFDKVRPAGITRFAVGEFAISRERDQGTTIIGTSATQAAWIDEQIPLFRQIEGLEAACYFHKHDGPASKDAKLDGPALLAYAQACRA